MQTRAVALAVVVAAGAFALGGLALVDACAPFDSASAANDGDAGSDAGADADAAVTRPSTADASAYVQAVLADTPLAYWRLDEAAGTVAHSLTGGGAFDGTIVGGAMLGAPGALNGDAGTALAFSSPSGQLVDVGDNFDFVDHAPFSLEAWIYLTGSDATFRHIFIKDSDSPARTEYGIYVRGTSAQVTSLSFERYINDASRFVLLTSLDGGGPPPVSLDAWHHVVGTYDGSVLALYVDGAPSGTVADTRDQPPKNFHFIFGAKTVNGGTILGRMDEVAVYGHALSAERVIAHFAAR